MPSTLNRRGHHTPSVEFGDSLGPMDDTQRNILGGAGVALVVAGLGSLTLSIWAVALVPVGLLMALLGFKRPGVSLSQLKPLEPLTPEDGAFVVPIDQDPRVSAMARIGELIVEGERLSWYPIERQEVEHGPWQNNVFDFLHDALQDPMPAQMIAMDRKPLEGHPVRDGLGTRLTRQLSYLRYLRRGFDMQAVKEDWQG